jgi:ABC-2 type transport system ATP-binding protein
MNDLLLQSERLLHCFGAHRALNRVSLSVRRGEVLALLGPNGAGKTTFQRLAMGLIEPTDGEIQVMGMPASRRARIGGSSVAGIGDGWEPPAWATISLLANLQAGAGRFDLNYFQSWCAAKKLGELDRFGHLSKGQKRWALCGLALACEPELILFDEPAEGLDTEARQGLYEALRAYADRRTRRLW